MTTAENERRIGLVEQTLYGNGREGLVSEVTVIRTWMKIQTVLLGAVTVAVITGVVGLIFGKGG